MARPKKYASEAERKAARNAAARARYAAKKEEWKEGYVMAKGYAPSTVKNVGRKTTAKMLQGAANPYAKYLTRPEQMAGYKPKRGRRPTQKMELGALSNYATKVKQPRAKKAKKATGTRKPNAYAMFVKDNFAAVKASNPGAKPAQIMKIIGGMWKSR